MTSDRLPTSTAHQARLRLFQPTRRPVYQQTELTTSWGVVRIKGRLGQTHADVFEAMFRCAEKRGVIADSDGRQRLKLLVDPAMVRKIARQNNSDGLERMINDILGAVIEIRSPEHLQCKGHLIDLVENAVDSRGRMLTAYNPLNKGVRPLWRVVIGEVGLRLLDGDLRLYYDPGPVAQLRHGVSQAVIRFLRGHDKRKQPNGGWTLDSVLFAVCGEQMSSSQRRDRRREVREDKGALSKLGIIINGDRIRVEQKHGGVEQMPEIME